MIVKPPHTYTSVKHIIQEVWGIVQSDESQRAVQQNRDNEILSQ